MIGAIVVLAVLLIVGVGFIIGFTAADGEYQYQQGFLEGREREKAAARMIPDRSVRLVFIREGDPASAFRREIHDARCSVFRPAGQCDCSQISAMEGKP